MFEDKREDCPIRVRGKRTAVPHGTFLAPCDSEERDDGVMMSSSIVKEKVYLEVFGGGWSVGQSYVAQLSDTAFSDRLSSPFFADACSGFLYHSRQQRVLPAQQCLTLRLQMWCML